MEYKLKTPIVLGEETIEVLKLEEPNTNKLETFGVSFAPDVIGSVKQMKAIVCSCSTNVNEGHVGVMKLRDLMGAWEKCQTSFFG